MFIRLSTSYQRFKVDSARWHNWDEATRKRHIEKFCLHKPAFSETFQKSSAAGRKPNQQQRKRARGEISVLVDRHDSLEAPFVPSLTLSKASESNNWRSIESSANSTLRFQDPDENKGKSFELHLRKDVSKLVKKCHGQCGKVISEKDILVVKSHGTTHWTDNDGNARSRFGPMYVHFERACLERFDSDNFYGPNKKFDYSEISVQKQCYEQLSKEEISFLPNLKISMP